MNTQHTPTPWFTQKGEYDGGVYLKINSTDHNRKMFVLVGGDVQHRSKDADFIVRAVNSHKALLEIAKSVLKLKEMDLAIVDEDADELNNLRDAIIAAEGQ